MSQPTGFRVHPPSVHDYADVLAESSAHLAAIAAYAKDKSAISRGFTGLLSLLTPVIGSVADLYGSVVAKASQKWRLTASVVHDAAEHYEQTDQLFSDQLKSLVSPAQSPAEAEPAAWSSSRPAEKFGIYKEKSDKIDRSMYGQVGTR
jgi:hypothetical protein